MSCKPQSLFFPVRNTFPQLPGFRAAFFPLLFLLLVLASCFPNILPSFSPSLPVHCCCRCLCLCRVSDSFCGPSPYSSAPLFQSEPPALAGLFRGRCTEVNRIVEDPCRGHQHSTSDATFPFVLSCVRQVLGPEASCAGVMCDEVPQVISPLK